MVDPLMEEIRSLLEEIKVLLVPVSDAHIDEYRRRESERASAKRASLNLILSTDKRRKAWRLADGTRTQRQIAQAAGMDEGGASRFFKQLRDIRAIDGSPNPKRVLEVEG